MHYYSLPSIREDAKILFAAIIPGPYFVKVGLTAIRHTYFSKSDGFWPFGSCFKKE